LLCGVCGLREGVWSGEGEIEGSENHLFASWQLGGLIGKARRCRGMEGRRERRREGHGRGVNMGQQESEIEKTRRWEWMNEEEVE
jgi:hypothetical protein